ncbi:MAG: hypothetical protein LBV79_04070, partial [Candidatus Adiutrix sp.]|nr:hypothetical protein [Candidatus Adiutrix sp.]
TYSAAAAAYYAHTHNFSAGANESGIDVYAVTMSSAYPELTFRKGTGGNEKITIMPVSITSKAVGRGLLLSFLNYYILEWHTDKSGNPFSATVQVNFSDAREADDWEMDAIITYRVELLTDAPGLNTTACLFHSSSTNWSCTPHPIEVDPDQRAPVSGILTTLPAKKYYGFQNNYGDIVYDPDTELRDQYITVNPGNVTGLAVYSRIEKHGSSSKMAMGYTISGSTKDGTYLDLSLRYNASDTLPSVYHTPPTCPEAKGAHSSCGQYHETPEQVRTFTFASSGGGSKFLENPLFLAAKYGGFKDPQNTGVPRTAAETNDLRWSTKEPGIPDNYFQATNISELSEQLGAAFQAIAKSVSTGTATASSVSSILGGGVSIQTLFYPEYKPPTGEEAIKWVGNIYGLFVDRFGNLREDTNGNNQLDIVTGEASALDQGDLVVQFVPDPDGGLPILSLRRDIKGDGDLIDAGTVESLEKLKTLWNTSQQLADMQEDTEDRPGAREAKSEASYGRESYAASAQGGRFIMTYYGSMSANPDGSWDQNPVALDNYLFRYDYGGGKNSPTNVRLAELMLQNSALSVGQSYPKTGAKRMYVRGQGQLPLDVETVKAQIKDGGTNKVTASISGPNLMITIERRNNCTAAELVEVINAAADLGIYNGAPIIRASLAAGDKGEWVVPISGAGNETIYDDADRSGDAEALIEYIRGDDKPGWRSRAVPSPWTMNPPPADAKVLCPGDSGGSEDCIVWRMGDIINSKPVIVGAPNSQFDFIYRDTSYAAYKLAQGRRRQVAYVGSNDGMLHAVNLGFFGSLENGAAGYTEAAPADAGFLSPPTEHKLGSELWAFVPPAVLPHLQWLADPEYDHSYYVDLKPQIVDIKNTTGFPVTMPGGNWEKNEWRTVLIGGLRLGGRTIRTKEAEGGNPSQHSYSEFFALDITNPEKAPILLWRFSSAELGLSTSLPAVVSSLSASGNGNEHNWYVVLGSGPTSDRPDGSSISNGKVAYDGSSTQSARLIVLDAFTGQRVHTMTVTDPEEEKSFFNDSFLPIVSQVRSKGTPEAQWDNNVAYFGLTKTLDSGNGQDTGAVYRLQMVDETTGEPFGKVADWRLARLFKTDQPVSQGSLSSRPVTGAVNAARDSRRNTWVLFGTGRMWSKADAQPCMGIGDPGDFDKCQENHEHFIYGLKEPMKYNTTLQQWLMTFEEITDKSKIVDVSTVEVYSNGTIKNFTKDDGTVDTGVKSYAALQNAMFSDDSLGYRRKLATWSITGDTGLSAGTQEVCLYQPKIEGLANGQSLATFTTYEPDVNVCNPEGKSYLHVIDTFTGVPAPYMYQMGFLPSDKVNSDSSNPDEATPGRHVTGYINAGRGKSTEAWISGDTIGTNGQDGTPYTLKLPTETALTNAVISWREILDMGFTMEPGQMFQGIEGLDD